MAAPRQPMAARLHAAWQRRGVLSLLLRPLAALAARAAMARRLAYLEGRKPAVRVPVPVAVVGNLYVGGTGKTPLLTVLVAGLRARGWTPGVVSRGYGVKIGDTPRVGQGRLDAARFGDEPALLAGTTGAPVAVHPRRGDAARALLRQHPEVDVVLADDGLQHLALARDVEILVEDARGVGNGLMLPAGPLREPASRRDTVDAIVINGADPGEPPAAGPRRCGMTVQPSGARRLDEDAAVPLADLAASGLRIAAAAGIGQPERFFASLAAAGVPLAATLALPDHHDYARSPFAGIDADLILVTEKDAVKCRHLRDPRLRAVPVTVRLSDPGFIDWLHDRLLAARRQRHLDPTAHGHPTA